MVTPSILYLISSRLKNLFNKRTKKQNSDDNKDDGYEGWFLIPYIPALADKFKNIADMINTKLAFFSVEKLGGLIRAQKDSLPKGFHKNVVYKLNCKNRDASYISQTKRRLNTRVNEHRRDINKKTPNHSVVTIHRSELNHDFDWDSQMILDKEEKYYKRLISEMINIKSHKNAINLQSDTELLQQSYTEIINRLIR